MPRGWGERSNSLFHLESSDVVLRQSGQIHKLAPHLYRCDIDTAHDNTQRQDT